MSTKKYEGSCHCGQVRFSAELDLSQGSTRCNCSYCAKVRSWNVSMKPAAFELLSGADALADYQFGSHSVHHQFCRQCGVRPFGQGYIEAIGGAFVSVSVSCLLLSDEELAAIPIRYTDGRANNWWNPPPLTRHL